MAAADAELQRTLATLPATGRGAATVTLSRDGLRADLGHRWTPQLTSAAYWSRDWTGTQRWGLNTRWTW